MHRLHENNTLRLHLDRVLACGLTVLVVALSACDTRASQENKVREVLERRKPDLQRCDQLLEAAMTANRKAAALVLANRYDEARQPLQEAQAMKDNVEQCRKDYQSIVLADSKTAGVLDEALIKAVGDKWYEETRGKR